MDVPDSGVTTEHLGICYHFCSQQCLENFTVRPKLYLGIKSEKQKGKRVIKKRSFVLDTPVPESGADALKAALSEMMGIRDVRVTGAKVSVTYDLLEATAIQIEQALEKADATLGSGWAGRLKRGWVHYTEENELDSLASTDAACCNKPPQRG